MALYFLPVMLLGVLSCDVLPKLFAEFPPSVEDMLKAREVIAGFDDAIVASNMADPIYGHEECGWIYASPKKPYMVPLRQKRKDTKRYECSLSNPYLMPDMWVVATYHIHPHGPPLADLSQIWSPSADDLNGIASQGVPGFVLSAYQEKLYTPYGLYRRPKYDKDKHLWP